MSRNDASSSTGNERDGPSSGIDPLLEVRHLEKSFSQTTNVFGVIADKLLRRNRNRIRAVDDVNLKLNRNHVQGIIGESGCGKTTLLMTVMGLHRATEGDIVFDGTPVSDFTKADWKEFRRRVQIIFQDPFDSLDPKFTVREALREPLVVHGYDDKQDRIYEMLERVRLTPPEKYLDRLPPQMSGGEKQRVSIARALILKPDIILADEPVSMLDVSTQSAILNLLRDIINELDVSMLYISHDLSTVSYVCDRVNVMYLGRIVESAPTQQLLDEPKHPYTNALTNAIPIPDPYHDRERTAITDSPADSSNLPTGCRFKDRCPERMEICDQAPLYRETDEATGHQVACHLYYDHERITSPNRREGQYGPNGELSIGGTDD